MGPWGGSTAQYSAFLGEHKSCAGGRKLHTSQNMSGSQSAEAGRKGRGNSDINKSWQRAHAAAGALQQAQHAAATHRL